MKKLLLLLLFIPIVSFSQTPITQSNIQDAVDLWVSNQTNAEEEYGHISDWDVSNVTNMDSLFQDLVFNQDISNWDVSSVVNLISVFSYSQFNQDISNWNISSALGMNNIFKDSRCFFHFVFIYKYYDKNLVATNFNKNN